MKLTNIMLKQQVKSLLDRIQYSYDELKDEKEIAIIDKYWIKTKYYSTIFISKGISYNIFI